MWLPKRSAIHYIFVPQEEFNKPEHHLFVDFSKTYDFILNLWRSLWSFALFSLGRIGQYIRCEGQIRVRLRKSSSELFSVKKNSSTERSPRIKMWVLVFIWKEKPIINNFEYFQHCLRSCFQGFWKQKMTWIDWERRLRRSNELNKV